MSTDPIVTEDDTLFLAPYGLWVDRADVLPFLAVLGQLDHVVDRVQLWRAGSGDAGSAGEAEVVAKVAQDRLTRLQKELGLMSDQVMQPFLQGMRLEIGDLHDALIDRADTHARRRALLAAPDVILPRVLVELMLDGLALPSLLRIAILRELAAEARRESAELDEATLRDVEGWLALLHWVGGGRALRERLAATGLDRARLARAVETIGLARRRHQRWTARVRDVAARAAAEPLAIDALLPPTPKRPGSRTRAEPAAQTAERVLAKKDVIGITRIAEITALDVLGIPVFNVVRPAAQVEISTQSGKGLTREEALVSGLMEAMEIFSAETPHRSPSPIAEASFAAPPEGMRLVDPQSLVLSTFANEPYDPARPVEWIRGVDLVAGGSWWLPLEVVAMGDVDLVLNSYQTSNGLASGNAFAEAVSHGLAELIERDAFKCLYFAAVEACIPPGELPVARIAREGLPERVREVAEKIESKGMALRLLDITSDVGVPVVWAMILEEKIEPEVCGHPADDLEVFSGWGAHPDPEVAILRAITEAVQTHTGNIQGSREDLDISTRSGGRRVGKGRNEAAVHVPFDAIPAYFRRLAEVVFSPTVPERAFAAMAGAENRDLRDDVEMMVRRLRAAGLEQVLVVDLTHPDVGMPVARVVVPGLEPIQLDRTGWRCHRFLLEPSSVFSMGGRHREL